MACAAISDIFAGTRARQRLSKNGCPSISPRTHRHINPLRERAAVVYERRSAARRNGCRGGSGALLPGAYQGKPDIHIW
jgi:hypothetical protein